MKLSDKNLELIRLSIVNSSVYDSSTCSLDLLIDAVVKKCGLFLSSLKSDELISKYLKKEIDSIISSALTDNKSTQNSFSCADNSTGNFAYSNATDNNVTYSCDGSINKSIDTNTSMPFVSTSGIDDDDFFKSSDEKNQNDVLVVSEQNDDEYESFFNDISDINDSLPDFSDSSEINITSNYSDNSSSFSPDDAANLTNDFSIDNMKNLASNIKSNVLSDTSNINDDTPPNLEPLSEPSDTEVPKFDLPKEEFPTLNPEILYKDVEDPIDNKEVKIVPQEVTDKILGILIEATKNSKTKDYMKIFYLKYIKKMKQVDIAKKLDISESALSEMYFDMVKYIKGHLY